MKTAPSFYETMNQGEELDVAIDAVASAYDRVAAQRMPAYARVCYGVRVIPTDVATKEALHGAHCTTFTFDGPLCVEWTQRVGCENDDYVRQHTALSRERVLTTQVIVTPVTSNGAMGPKFVLPSRGMPEWDATLLEAHSSFPGDAPVEIGLGFCTKTKMLLFAELKHTPDKQPGLFAELQRYAVEQERERLLRLPESVIFARLGVQKE